MKFIKFCLTGLLVGAVFFLASCDPKLDDLGGCRVTYAGGQNAGGTAITAVVDEGSVMTVAGNPFFRRGYRFTGWEYGGNTYQPYTSTITVMTDITLTAMWTAVPNPLYIIDGNESRFTANNNTMDTIKQTDGGGNSRSILRQSFPGSYTYVAFMGDFISGPFDISGYTNVHISMYVPDAESIQGWGVELASGGNFDANELDWKTGNINSGWNDLIFTIDSAAQEWGPADKTNINFSRIYIVRAASMASEFQIADFYVY